MDQVNVIVICERNQGRRVLNELLKFGRFEKSIFPDVLTGEVENRGMFLTTLYRKQSIPISRVIPIEEFFSFQPEQLVENLKIRIGKYIEGIGANDSFCINVERRGSKSIISTMALKRELGEYVRQALKRRHENEPTVNLENPDKTLTIQMIANMCGIGLISKQLTNRFSFVWVK